MRSNVFLILRLAGMMIWQAISCALLAAFSFSSLRDFTTFELLKNLVLASRDSPAPLWLGAVVAQLIQVVFSATIRPLRSIA